MGGVRRTEQQTLIVPQDRSTNTEKKASKFSFSQLFSSLTQQIRNKGGNYIGNKLTHVKSNPEKISKNLDTRSELIKSGSAELKKIVTKGNSAKRLIELDALQIKPKEPSEKWIIIFNGVGDQYEGHLKALEQLAEDVGANVLTFNYRGVGDSKGKKAKSAQELVDDGESVIKYLKETGISKKNMLLYGHSMGGGVAAEVYSKTMNNKGSLVSESSFSTLSAAVKEKRGKLVSYLFKKLKWDLDGFTSFQAAQGNKAVIVNRRDPTVRYQEASLYKQLTKELEEGQELHRLKIGSKRDVDYEPKVKVDPKTKVSKEEKVPLENKPSEYKKAYSQLKKKGLIKYLYHPHQRIMDRLQNVKDPVKPSKTLSKVNADAINQINNKFNKEDDQAYAKMTALFKEFLDIQMEASEVDNRVLIVDDDEF